MSSDTVTRSTLCKGATKSMSALTLTQVEHIISRHTGSANKPYAYIKTLRRSPLQGSVSYEYQFREPPYQENRQAANADNHESQSSTCMMHEFLDLSWAHAFAQKCAFDICDDLLWSHILRSDTLHHKQSRSLPRWLELSLWIRLHTLWRVVHLPFGLCTPKSCLEIFYIFIAICSCILYSKCHATCEPTVGIWVWQGAPAS